MFSFFKKKIKKQNHTAAPSKYILQIFFKKPYNDRHEHFLKEEVSSVSYNGHSLTYSTSSSASAICKLSELNGFMIQNLDGDIIYTHGDLSLFTSELGWPLSIQTNYFLPHLLKHHIKTPNNNTDLSFIDFSGNVAFIGRTGSGKSFLIKNMLENSRWYNTNKNTILYFGRSYDQVSDFEYFKKINISKLISLSQTNSLKDGVKYFICIDEDQYKPTIEDIVELKKVLMHKIHTPITIVFDEPQLFDTTLSELYANLVRDITSRTKKNKCLANTFTLSQDVEEMDNKEIKLDFFDSLLFIGEYPTVSKKHSKNTLDTGEFLFYSTL